jgi:hypothetical protein
MRRPELGAAEMKQVTDDTVLSSFSITTKPIARSQKRCYFFMEVIGKRISGVVFSLMDGGRWTRFLLRRKQINDVSNHLALRFARRNGMKPDARLFFIMFLASIVATPCGDAHIG